MKAIYVSVNLNPNNISLHKTPKYLDNHLLIQDWLPKGKIIQNKIDSKFPWVPSSFNIKHPPSPIPLSPIASRMSIHLSINTVQHMHTIRTSPKFIDHPNVNT